MGQCYVCLPAPEVQSPWLLEHYCKELGGYQSWLKIIDESIPPADVIDIIKASGLRGRGGAGFSPGLQPRFIPPGTPGPEDILCNSVEREPGTV